jgi:hypothetical protein
LIGRDLNGRSEEHRREPSFASAPEPRLATAECAMHRPSADQEEDDEPAAARAATHANGLSRGHLQALRTVLQDLMECRTLIDAAVARPE